MAEDSKTITFRASEKELPQLARLKARAKDEGKTPGNWAKEAAFQKLDESGSIEELRDRLISIEASVETMNQEIRFSVETILVTLGLIKPDMELTAEKVKEWRAKKLKSS